MISASEPPFAITRQMIRAASRSENSLRRALFGLAMQTTGTGYLFDLRERREADFL